MNLWEQYNPGHSLGTVLSERTTLPLQGCDDKALFASLKRHVTRRELRCFVLGMSGMTATEIAADMELSVEEAESLLFKVLKKLRQPKVQQALRLLAAEAGDDTPGMDEGEK